MVLSIISMQWLITWPITESDSASKLKVSIYRVYIIKCKSAGENIEGSVSIFSIKWQVFEFITDTDSRAETALSVRLWKSMGPLDNTGRLFFAIKAWLCSSIPSSHISIHDKLSVSVFSWPVGRRQNDIQLMHVIIILTLNFTPRATCYSILITSCQSIKFY